MGRVLADRNAGEGAESIRPESIVMPARGVLGMPPAGTWMLQGVLLEDSRLMPSCEAWARIHDRPALATLAFTCAELAGGMKVPPCLP